MKIAFVGKGGSGKSSISWLITKAAEEKKQHVLAIDADHNMDLVSNLGQNPDATITMHKSDKAFMESAMQTCCNNHNEDHHHTPHFSITPMDPYTTSIAVPLSPYLSLINIGLGSPEVAFQTSCAHGLSGPLKYYLGFLEEKDALVVIDSVAGADMLNYGLYAGIDAVICVIEPHHNSIKVFEQIHAICKKTMIPCYTVINKPNSSPLYESFKHTYNTIILGEVPLDHALLEYSYDHLQEETKESARKILEQIYRLKKGKALTDNR